MRRNEKSSYAGSKAKPQDLIKSRKTVLEILCYTEHKNLQFRVKFESSKRHIHLLRQLGPQLEKREKVWREENELRDSFRHLRQGQGTRDSTRGENGNTILYKGIRCK